LLEEARDGDTQEAVEVHQQQLSCARDVIVETIDRNPERIKARLWHPENLLQTCWANGARSRALWTTTYEHQGWLWRPEGRLATMMLDEWVLVSRFNLVKIYRYLNCTAAPSIIIVTSLQPVRQCPKICRHAFVRVVCLTSPPCCQNRPGVLGKKDDAVMPEEL
jgi:hypothetical protein